MRAETKAETQGKVFTSPSPQILILKAFLKQQHKHTIKKYNTFHATFFQKSESVSEAAIFLPPPPPKVADFWGVTDSLLKEHSEC